MKLERIEALHAAMVILVAGLAALTGWLQVGGLVLGGGVMWLNFWLLKNLVRRVLQPGRGPMVAVVLFTAKLGLFLGLVAMAFSRVPIDGPSFAVGITLLLIACVVEALRAAPSIPSEGTV